MLSICPPSDASTKTILSSILTGYLADFQQDLRLQCAAIVNASVEAYNRCTLVAQVKSCTYSRSTRMCNCASLLPSAKQGRLGSTGN